MYALTKWFGWCNLIPATVGLLLLPWFEIPGFRNKESLFLVLLLQVLVSFSLVYASRQKIAGTRIADKVYPSSIAAYILFVLFALRWMHHVS